MYCNGVYITDQSVFSRMNSSALGGSPQQQQGSAVTISWDGQTMLVGAEGTNGGAGGQQQQQQQQQTACACCLR